jgi:hypothetical protein
MTHSNSKNFLTAVHWNAIQKRIMIRQHQEHFALTYTNFRFVNLVYIYICCERSLKSATRYF